MIARDGSCSVCGRHTVSPYAALSNKFANTVFDVAIVGGGITGITLGLAIAESR